MVSKLPNPLGSQPFFQSPLTPAPLGTGGAASPDTSSWFVADTPGPLGHGGDWADPNVPGAHHVMLALNGKAVPLAVAPAPAPEYAPDLNTTQATIEMYDSYFTGPKGALLKSRIEKAARQVQINPGLLAASLFAEDARSSYTQQSGEVDGWTIGTDDYKEREARLHREIPASTTIKPTRYASQTNEQGREIKEVPVFKAADATLASAVYLKDSENSVRKALHEMGGEFDFLPVEERFALTRFALNAGSGAMRKQLVEFLGLTLQRGNKYLHNATGREFLGFTSGTLKNGVEQFDSRHPRRAATVHTAQAIHLSQKIFNVDPLAGAPDALLLNR